MPSVQSRSNYRKKCKRAVILYVRGMSEVLARVFSDYDAWVAHVLSSKLRGQLMRAKEPLERSRYLGVVYKINNKESGETYVGETGNFKKRIRQHQCDVIKGSSVSNSLSECRARSAAHSGDTACDR